MFLKDGLELERMGLVRSPETESCCARDGIFSREHVRATSPKLFLFLNLRQKMKSEFKIRKPFGKSYSSKQRKTELEMIGIFLF